MKALGYMILVLVAVSMAYTVVNCGGSTVTEVGDDSNTSGIDSGAIDNGSGTSTVAVDFFPSDGTVDASWKTEVVVTFSGAITTPTDPASNVSLTEVGGDGTDYCASGVVTATDTAITCVPPGGLSQCLQYDATISGLADANGDTIAEASATFQVKQVAGDLNSDGYADALVGFFSGDGTAYIYYGGESGISTTAAVTYSGPVVDSNFGSTVSSHGDFNGDCIVDALIAAPYHSGHGADKVYIYFGSTALSGSDAPDVTFVGGGTDDFGSVASAGDFNGDGYDDAIIGAYQYNSGAGRVYIYNGSAESTMNAAADQTIDSPGSNSFGISVAAGDLNNDDYDDAIVGQNYDLSVHIFYGSANGLSNTTDVVLGPGSIPAGETASFGYAVSSGDVNGDGFDDVIVGSDFGGSGAAGKIHIFNGSAGGVVNTTADIVITGSTAGERLAYKVSSGDFNGDGFDDVIAKGTSGAYIYFGAANVDGVPSMDTTSDVYFAGTSINSVSSGDFDSDGFADAILAYAPATGSGIFYGSADMTGTLGEDVTLGRGGVAAGGSSP